MYIIIGEVEGRVHNYRGGGGACWRGVYIIIGEGDIFRLMFTHKYCN